MVPWESRFMPEVSVSPDYLCRLGNLLIPFWQWVDCFSLFNNTIYVFYRGSLKRAMPVLVRSTHPRSCHIKEPSFSPRIEFTQGKIVIKKLLWLQFLVVCLFLNTFLCLILKVWLPVGMKFVGGILYHTRWFSNNHRKTVIYYKWCFNGLGFLPVIP